MTVIPPIQNRNQHAVLIIAILACFLPVIVIEYFALKHTGSIMIYPVDDAFIHMELAGNLARYGNWGINSHEFGAASSSLLYTLILALLFKIFSVHVIIPLIVNIIAAIILLVSIYKWLARQGLELWKQVSIFLLVIFLTPLPILIISGMEHVLQCLFSFLFLFHAGTWLGETNNEKHTKTHFSWKIPTYAFLLVATRYEGIFLVAVVCLLLLMKGRFIRSIQLGLIALLPVLIFGFYSLSKGSFFLPNSVLIKSDEIPLFDGGIKHFFEALFIEKFTLAKAGITAMATQRMLLFLPLTALIFYRPLKKDPAYFQILLIIAIVTVLHLGLASTGKFYRYEAYIFLCGILIMMTVFLKYFRELIAEWKWPAYLLAFILLFFLALPVLLRTSAAFSKSVRACMNIYDQQYQMGKFLEKYYPHESVAANDIGAVSFYTKGEVVDLWGLGSIEVAKSRRGKYWTASFLDSLCRSKGSKLAIIYDSWFENDPLGVKWKKIATWQIRDNVVCGDDTVSFYAIDPAIANDLKKNLESWQASLPGDVKVVYY